MNDLEELSDIFMELASHQRLEILDIILEHPEKASKIAKIIDATPQEVARNLDRLEKTGLITKNHDSNYQITSIGKIVYSNVPLVRFVINHKEYLESHSIQALGERFVSMLGMLSESKPIIGYVLVQEKIKSVYQNSTNYVYNMITEVSPELFEISLEKCNKGIKVQNIFSKKMISTEQRKELVKKDIYKKLIQNELLQKRVKDDLNVLININEKEALLCLPNSENRYDLSQALYSSDTKFHEWCLDFFNHTWSESHAYIENRTI